MNLTPILTIILLYLFHHCHSLDNNVLQYLDEKATIVKQRFTRDNHDIKDVTILNLPKNYTKGDIFILLNTTYTLMDEDLYTISSNNSLNLKYSFKWREPATLVKTTTYGKLGLILIATKSGIAHIYGVHNTTKHFKIQNIANFDITDAMFFENNNNLYLIILNNLGQQALIFKYIGTHFDVIETIQVTQASKLNVFNSNGNTIILLLHYKDSKSLSSVYRFKFDQIRKIQKIEISHMKEVMCYKQENKLYVMFYNNKDTSALVYFWSGDALQFSKELFLSGNQIQPVSTNTSLIFLISQKNKINFYYNNHIGKSIDLENHELKQVLEIPGENHNNNSVHLAFIGVTEKGFSEIGVSSTTVVISAESNKTIEKPKVSKCMTSLETAIYDLRREMREIANFSANPLLGITENTNTTFLTKLNRINSTINDYSTDPSHLIINGNAILDNSLKAESLKSSDLNFQNINNKKWKSDHLLTYSSPQNISGLVQTKNIAIEHLDTKKNIPLFNDLLLSGGLQNISGKVKVNELEANEMQVAQINDIRMQKVYYKNNPVIINGVKQFSSLHSEGAKIGSINEMKGSDVMLHLVDSKLSKFKFEKNLTIHNLQVENINDVNFEAFKNSVFRTSEDTIDGSLTFSNLTIKNANFQRLDGKRNVLTTSTDQSIKSEMFIDKIMAKQIESKMVNDINFSDSVATFDNNTIHGHVKMDNVHVNVLEMIGKHDLSMFSFHNEHIIGTTESDFLQIYNDKVTIKGDLFLNNFEVEQLAELVVFHKNFDIQMDKFWTKSTEQSIPVHCQAMNGITTSNFFTKLINGVDVNDYLLNSTIPHKNTTYNFDHVLIRGNVTLNPDEDTPQLKKIQEESVKLTGIFKITGHKTYDNNLKVNHLEGSPINMNGLTNPEFSADQGELKHILIKGDLKSKNVVVDNINRINISDLINNTIYTDQPLLHNTKMNFSKITVNNLNITHFNNANMEEYISQINQINEMKSMDSLTINGNTTIASIQNVAQINGISIADIKNNSMKHVNSEITGDFKFLGKMKIRNFYVETINNIDFVQLNQRLLFRKWNQHIKAPFTFNTLKSKNLKVSHINDFYLENLFDAQATSPQNIYAPNGLQVLSPMLVHNLKIDTSCNLEDTFTYLQHPLRDIWENIEVKNNATFWDQESSMCRIFENAVSKQKNLITGAVHFSEHINVDKVTSHEQINGINFAEIIQDAVLTVTDEKQIITGKKRFTELVADTVVSLQNMNIEKVNNFNISEIDDKIISNKLKGDIVSKGKKTFFGGLQTKHLHVKHIKSEMTPENIVTYNKNQQIPSAIFESVKVNNNLNIETMNAMPFDSMLDQTVLVNSGKQICNNKFVFKKMTIKGNLVTPDINDIKIKHVVFDEGIQIIESKKIFKDDFNIDGYAIIEYFNGLELAKIYEQALYINEENRIKGVMNVMQLSEMYGNINTKSINGIANDYIVDVFNAHTFTKEADRIQQVTSKIARFIEYHLNLTINMPSTYSYLEKSRTLQISVPSITTAQIIEATNEVLIHFRGEKPGDYCGLPESCKCPVQSTMQVTSGHSVNALNKAETRRIYTYLDEKLSIHFITNSISTNSICRTNHSKIWNEMSTLTWNTVNSKTSKGRFYIHEDIFKGYISAVQFFTIYEETYIVVGRYYDPVLNTHQIESLLLKFNEDKTKVQQIQTISTEGLQEMSVIHTAQGVILVISNVNLEEKNKSTKILLFNNQIEKFELLREVPSFEAVSAVGVVLGTETLLVLANQYSTLHILRYHNEYHNYYFYQSMQLEFSVSSMSVFYTGDFGISDAYLNVVTKSNQFFIYSFQFIEGWKLVSHGALPGLKGLIPFKIKKESFLFVPSSEMSYLLTFE